MSLPEAQFVGDEIGPWSEVKLEIIRKYASAYSRILTAKKLAHAYIDGFAGSGEHISRSRGERVPGSPTIAMAIVPPFREYHFIDLQSKRVAALKQFAEGRSDVFVHQGDCNDVLLTKVFPRVRWEDYRRGLCLLDPYGMQLRWEVVQKAGRMRSIDMLLHFPIGTINRNVLCPDPQPGPILSMKALWGDESWSAIVPAQGTLFAEMGGRAEYPEMAEAFRKRLRDVAGFQHVPRPILMKNGKGAPLYYIFFASQVGVAEQIIGDIFESYRRKGW